MKKAEEIKKVAIIGAGTMGSQLAELFSRVGKCEVNIVDVSDEILDRALEGIRAGLKKFLVDKGKMSQEEMEEVVRRIKPVKDIPQAVAEAEYVLEAIIENLAVKKDVFRQIDANLPPDAIIASNTSGLSITEMASATKRPDRVVGMHFFNPVPVMKLVEVVRGALTSEETVGFACELSRRLGKEPVVCKDVGYGFLANRAYGPMVQEALQIVWERIASPEDVDKALKLGYNLPMGPLELMDMVGGWGVMSASEEDRIRELGPEKGRLHPLVRWMIRAGYTGGPGRKGIYDFWKDVLSK